MTLPAIRGDVSVLPRARRQKSDIPAHLRQKTPNSANPDAPLAGRGGACHVHISKLTLLVAALLRADRSNGGWVLPNALAEEVGVSRATVYRWLNFLERAGWPIERDDTYQRSLRRSLGVRSLLVAQHRGIDGMREHREAP